MSLIYISILRNRVVLCEYTESNGNFQQISDIIIKRTLECDDEDLVIPYEDYLFYIRKVGDVNILCLVDHSENELILSLIDDIKNTPHIFHDKAVENIKNKTH